MTVPAEWLRFLNETGTGPLALYAVRGDGFSQTVTIDADLTGATIAGSIRSAPDASPALADFTVSALTVADGVTTFTISLTIEQTSTLPEDTAGRGVIELPWALRITMPGFEEALLVGGPFQLAGRV